jgi:endonuclease YncB( thermonuclease family)
MTKALSVSTYTALRDKVRETLLFGQKRIEEAKVRTYWETGRYINEHLQVNGARTSYGEKVIRRLGDDVKLHYSVLQKCSQFAEMFPKFKIVSARRQLTWAHYRALLTVPDEKKRLQLVDRAIKEDWVSRDLEIEVRNLLWDERVEKSDGKVPLLLAVPVLGPFFTYKIIKPETIHSKSNELLIDLGFSTVLELNRISDTAFKSDALVTSVKNAKGKYSLDVARCALSGLYTYQAFVERVVDGDTLKVEIDLGFNVRTRQYIRLRGIDCPEMDTKEGVAAKRFVENALQGLESITLKTVKSDKYDRYLGDVFLPARSLKASATGPGATRPECNNEKAGQQQYLNNILLEKGMAVRVRS